ncbi:MAG TPA: two-component regulator propeller domain-containing protein [Bacteroidia bacterium]|jgi:ligand-binding sensor domain-containing protein/serine phosphatase RsbU (regulator of sigma subunit)
MRFIQLKHTFLTLLLFLLCRGNITAQELKFSHITAEQGLTMGVVNCVLQDSRGFMWFGTQDGLNKYDGYNITVFKHNPLDTNSLSNNFINFLYEDKNSILWIGTDGGGLDAYDLVTGRFRHFRSGGKKSNSISNNKVRCMLEDNEGLLWIGTDEGLNVFDKTTNTFTNYLNDSHDPYSISNNAVWCLAQTKDGMIWLGTFGGGLNSFDKRTKRFKRYQKLDERSGLPVEHSNQVRSVFKDKDGIFWIGTFGDGIQVFDPNTGTFLKNIVSIDNDPNALSHNAITSVAEDEQGVLWIGTYGGGVDLYFKKTGKFRHYKFNEKDPNSINSDRIKCVYHDKTGSVWIGTEGGGVNSHFRASSKFEFYKKKDDSENSLKSNVVLALLQDRSGLIWIGTSEGGLSTLNRETDTYTQYPKLSTAGNNSVLSLCEDQDGIIWVGTWGRGLNSYDKRTREIKTYSVFQPQNNATIICIMQDRKGLIWVGTYKGGVFSYDKKKNVFTHYTMDSGLSSNNIYTLFEDSKGIIWIGTEGGGVNAMNVETGHIRTYARDERNNSISSNSINHIYEDASHNLWFATANGLNKFDRSTEHFEHYFEKDGLPNDYIYCILPDKQGMLWMTTNKGISRFNPAVKNVNGSAFRNYDVSDGLQGMEHNQGAFFRAKSGEMFIGGVNGFNAFDPQKLSENKHLPPVRIISYKRFGKEVELDTLIYNKKYLELSWKQNFFSFDFVALDFQLPGKNRYSYKLDGVDDEWSPPGSQRYASYTELSGGDYVFRVRAANSDGIWNNEGVTLYIRINPPFWKTKLFYASCILFILAGFWGFLKYRTSSIKRENKLLEEKVQERTRELAQKNKDITSSIQYAKRIQLAILPPLEQIFKYYPDSFVFYRPKDIVSGDFYWFGIKNGRRIIAVVDCTGHGVPGAFMSMIGHNLLNQIIIENGIISPGEILNALHKGVQSALKQGTNVVDTSDGMDVAICSISEDNSELQYAGAYRPLFILNGIMFDRIEADKFPIGGSQLDAQRKYTNHTLKINKGDTFYMSSDGYADQFGGEKGKKFMVKRFNELLLSIQDKPMEEQGRILEETFSSWRGEFQQVDDILVMGIRFD